MPGYVGIDLSPEAVRRAKIGRPEGEYLVGRLADFSVRADLTVCLDVLIHQSDAAVYRDQVARLWESADRALLISGYEQPLGTVAPIDHFHEPLGDFACDGVPEYYPVRRRAIATFLVLRPLPRIPYSGPPPCRPSSINTDPLIAGSSARRAACPQFLSEHVPQVWGYHVHRPDVGT
jgi:hypothetical protein